MVFPSLRDISTDLNWLREAQTLGSLRDCFAPKQLLRSFDFGVLLSEFAHQKWWFHGISLGYHGDIMWIYWVYVCIYIYILYIYILCTHIYTYISPTVNGQDLSNICCLPIARSTSTGACGVFHEASHGWRSCRHVLCASPYGFVWQ